MIRFSFLPTLNAALNAASALLLVAGYAFIRRGKVTQHKACMGTAFALSVAFLISYLTYHFQVGSVRFQGTGWIRPLYFVILISHSALAALVPLLALITLSRALKGNFAAHRRIARWTLPVWLYVSLTGIIVYWMVYRLYPGG